METYDRTMRPVAMPGMFATIGNISLQLLGPPGLEADLPLDGRSDSLILPASFHLRSRPFG